MKKMKLKLDRDEMTTLTTIIKETIERLDVEAREPNVAPATKIISSVLRDVLITAFLRKLCIPAIKFNVSLKEFEAESLNVALRSYEIYTNNPYVIALIEKVKSTPVI